MSIPAIFVQQVHDAMGGLMARLPGIVRRKAGYFRGGKQLRSSLLYQVSRSLGVSESDVVLPSAILELVHTTTILHDDVIDQAESRRGKATVNASLKSRVAVFAADVLFGQAMAELSTWAHTRGSWGRDVERCFHRHIRAVCEGEMVQDLVMEVNTNPALEACIEVARGKTGALFALSFGVPGYMARVSPQSQIWLEEAGSRYGTLFQLVDDVDDVVEDSRKPLTEGGYTLRQWTYASALWRNLDPVGFKSFVGGVGTGPSPEIRRDLVNAIGDFRRQSAEALTPHPQAVLEPVWDLWEKGSGALMGRIQPAPPTPG